MLSRCKGSFQQHWEFPSCLFFPYRCSCSCAGVMDIPPFPLQQLLHRLLHSDALVGARLWLLVWGRSWGEKKKRLKIYVTFIFLSGTPDPHSSLGAIPEHIYFLLPFLCVPQCHWPAEQLPKGKSDQIYPKGDTPELLATQGHKKAEIIYLKEIYSLFRQKVYKQPKSGKHPHLKNDLNIINLT